MDSGTYILTLPSVGRKACPPLPRRGREGGVFRKRCLAPLAPPPSRGSEREGGLGGFGGLQQRHHGVVHLRVGEVEACGAVEDDGEVLQASTDYTMTLS